MTVNTFYKIFIFQINPHIAAQMFSALIIINVSFDN